MALYHLDLVFDVIVLQSKRICAHRNVFVVQILAFTAEGICCLRTLHRYCNRRIVQCTTFARYYRQFYSNNLPPSLQGGYYYTVRHYLARMTVRTA